MKGRRILIPSAAVTRDVLPNELRKRGAAVNVVEAYPECPARGSGAQAETILREPYPNWLTFTSPSSFENLFAVAGADSLRQIKIASIGPVTSDAVRKHALTVAVEANPHSVAGLVDAIVRA